ncbi:hypothetical protein Vadar_022783 [Vaccinium darrowii]|uniref:Uncharacterized protein n=1 Tax=Vaccinium darrowii TaxID=229202 RepID=A0ACB7ZE54_9ERIC|nr:hypothetical protein Vadar_022783 [Vaccinium darrowii]
MEMEVGQILTLSFLFLCVRGHFCYLFLGFGGVLLPRVALGFRPSAALQRSIGWAVHVLKPAMYFEIGYVLKRIYSHSRVEYCCFILAIFCVLAEVMAVQEPFVRWLFVKHPLKFCRNGGFFYMETGRGDRVIVAAAVDNGANHLYFRASSTFVAYYRGILPLGNVFRWDFRKDVVAWLNSVVYHSFVRYSEQHVGRCWFVLDVPGPEFTGPTRIPSGLAHVFQGQGVGKWILLKHGNKTWSVFVCDNELTCGWEEFCDAHDLRVNYKVVIGCERRWVFEVFVLDDTNISVVYPWSRADHGWQALLPLPGNIVSSCLPSALERQQLDLKFMLLVTPDVDYLMELQNCVSQLFRDTGMQEIKIRMGTRAWIVPFVDGGLDSVILGQFVAALELDVFDSVFVTVSPTLELQVIVFDDDNVERAYEWLLYPRLT